MSNKSIFELSETLNICDLWNTRFNEYNKIFSKQNNKKIDDDSETLFSSSPLHIVNTYNTKYPPIVQTIGRTLSDDKKNYIFESKFENTNYPPIIQTMGRTLSDDKKNYIFESYVENTNYPPIIQTIGRTLTKDSNKYSLVDIK